MKRFLCLILLALFLFLLAAPPADATGRIAARRAVVVNPFAFGFTFATPVVPVAAFAVPAAVAVQPVVQQPVVQAPVTAAIAPVQTQAVVPTFAAVTPTFAASTFAFTPFASVAVATPTFIAASPFAVIGHRRAFFVPGRRHRR